MDSSTNHYRKSEDLWDSVTDRYRIFEELGLLNTCHADIQFQRNEHLNFKMFPSKIKELFLFNSVQILYLINSLQSLLPVSEMINGNTPSDDH